MTMSVKRPVLGGTKIAAPRPATTANTQRYGEIMEHALNLRDPLLLARNRARDARNAASDEVNAGRATAPTPSEDYTRSAESAQSTALCHPFAVTARFVTARSKLVAEETVTVSVESVVNATGQVVPAPSVAVPITRFKLPRGYDLADPAQSTARFDLPRGETVRRGVAEIQVEEVRNVAHTDRGSAYTVEATPIMVVDGVRFPARKPWEFSARVDSSDMQVVAAALREVMEAQLRQSMPQVKIAGVNWAADYATAEIELEHRPRSFGQARPGSANLLPGGEVLGVFPAGFTPAQGELTESNARRVSAVSRALTDEIARASGPVRRRAGLEPLQPVAVGDNEVGLLVAVCEAAARMKSTKPTELHERLFDALGRRRNAELLYPRQRRRGDDSAQRLANVFVRSAETALDEGRKAALLSPTATGVTAGIVVYGVDDYSKDYELSVSVFVHEAT